MQPSPGRGPIALHGRGSNPHYLRGFLQRKAGEETQLNYMTLPRIDLSQAIQRIIQRNDIDVFALRQGVHIAECEHADAASSF